MIDVLTGVVVDVGVLGDVDIIVEAVVVIVLEFSLLISYVLDVLAGVMICCVSDIGVDVLTDMNVISLTAPSEGAMPSFLSAFDCRAMTALDRASVLQLWIPAYQV